MLYIIEHNVAKLMIKQSMRGSVASLVVGICVGLGALPCQATDTPHPTVAQCQNKGIEITALETADAVTACEGALAAVAFMATLSLELTHDITIKIADELPLPKSTLAAGCYEVAKEKISLLNYSTLKKTFDDWHGLPIDRHLYSSLAAHEVAHAVASCHFTIQQPTLIAEEYIAYIVMISSMPPDLRQRVLQAFPGQGFVDDWEMTPTMYLMAPMFFAVQAYRHYLMPGNGRDFLFRVLAGEVLTEDDYLDDP